MSEQRRGTFYLIFLGIILGFVSMSFFAPKLIVWYSKPPFAPGVDCTPAIDWGLSQIIKWQVAGMVVGSLALWGLSVLVRRKRGL
jgi:hypothetical protein